LLILNVFRPVCKGPARLAVPAAEDAPCRDTDLVQGCTKQNMADGDIATGLPGMSPILPGWGEELPVCKNILAESANSVISADIFL
jgi:hypothetical protein